MSIYGPEPPEAELATGPDNHALKARLDAQVGLRVLLWRGSYRWGEIWYEAYHKSTHHLII